MYSGRVTPRRTWREPRAAEEPEHPPVEDRYVAVVDDATLVIAPRREEAESMVRALRRGEQGVPAWWRDAAAGLPLESPIVILRRYDPTNARDYLSPENPLLDERQRAGLRMLGLALVDAKEGVFRLRGVTGDSAQARRVLMTQKYLPQSDFAWEVEEEGDEAFVATLRLRGRGEEIRGALPLRLMIMWGVNLVI